jgi:hypothetical protein
MFVDIFMVHARFVIEGKRGAVGAGLVLAVG